MNKISNNLGTTTNSDRSRLQYNRYCWAVAPSLAVGRVDCVGCVYLPGLTLIVSTVIKPVNSIDYIVTVAP